jgi:hypothetical protein
MTEKKFHAGCLAALVLFALAGPLSAFQGLTMQRDVVVGAHESQDEVVILGGSAVIDGRVRKNVVAIGGTVTVSGEVDEAVVGFGARIILKETAVVRGDVVALGGTLQKEPGCMVGGDTVYFRSAEIGDKLFKNGVLAGIITFPLLPIILAIKLVMAFLWLIVALVGAAVFPKQIALASGEVRKSFWPAFGIGLLAHIIFAGLVLFAFLLSFILIGIPVFLALIVSGTLIWIFGRLAVFHFFGDSLRRAFGSRSSTATGAVLLGVLFVSLIDFIPLVGFLFTLFINILGWGIAIRTKFGSTENMFLKKPAPPAPAPPVPAPPASTT